MLRVTGATKKHPAKQRGKQIPGPYPGFEGTAAGINALRRLGAAGRSFALLRMTSPRACHGDVEGVMLRHVCLKMDHMVRRRGNVETCVPEDGPDGAAKG